MRVGQRSVCCVVYTYQVSTNAHRGKRDVFWTEVRRRRIRPPYQCHGIGWGGGLFSEPWAAVSIFLNSSCSINRYVTRNMTATKYFRATRPTFLCPFVSLEQMAGSLLSIVVKGSFLSESFFFPIFRHFFREIF